MLRLLFIKACPLSGQIRPSVVKPSCVELESKLACYSFGILHGESQSWISGKSLSSHTYTAGIDWLKTAGWAVLKQPCLTSDQTGTDRPKPVPASQTGLSDWFPAGTGHHQPGTNQADPFDWCKTQKCCKNLLLNGKGDNGAQTLPFYTIRKTRPPRLLGSIYLVIGWLVQDTCGWLFKSWWWWWWCTADVGDDL
jgi:hypothetical protein